MAPGVTEEGRLGAGLAGLRRADAYVVLVRGEVQLLVVAVQVEEQDLRARRAQRLQPLELGPDGDGVHS